MSARTLLLFCAFVFAQVANAFVVRRSGQSVFGGLAKNRFLLISLVLVVALQVVLVQVPALNEIARTVPLEPWQWALAVAAALVWPLVRELWYWPTRLIRARSHRDSSNGAA